MKINGEEMDREKMDWCRRRALDFAWGYYMQFADREDAIGEAMLAAVMAEKKLDPARPWQPFFAVAVDRRLRTWSHQRRLVKSSYGRRHEPQPKVTALGDHDVAMPADYEVDSFPMLVQLVRCLPRLKSPYQRQLLAFLLAGESCATIAKRLSVSHQSVWQGRVRLINDLKWMLSSELL